MSETPADYFPIDWEHPYSDVVLKRRESHYAARRRCWYDPGAGALLHDDGHFDYADPAQGYAHLLEYLDALSEEHRPRFLMVCGGVSSIDTPSREQLQAPAEHGWTARMRLIAAGDDGPSKGYDRAHVTYSRNGRIIELRLTAEWFGDCHDVSLCRDAWRLLEQRLRGAFNDPGVRLISTPGRSGLDLLERTLPRHKAGEEAGWSHQYPCLADGPQRLLRRNNGQGRNELIEIPGRDELAGLYQLDGRWMYAACLTNLPSGPVRHDTLDEYEPYTVGFYRVSGRVPKGWRHIGLLPTLYYRGETSVREWPRRPGARYSGWVSSAELAVAAEHLWEFDIHERILWPAPAGDPAKGWITKLRQLREHCERQAGEGNPRDGLMAAALRNMVLQTVGSWHRGAGMEYGTQPASEARLPAGAELIGMRGGQLQWRRPTTLSEPQFCHPEWSATVWGRARARLAKQALAYPLASLVALRTDALWLDFAPEVVDDGRPGTFRLKGAGISEPRPAPHEEWELLSLMREARA